MCAGSRSRALPDVLASSGELRAAINSDAAWTLMLAGRGARRVALHACIRINPRLIVSLRVAFVWLSDAFGISSALSPNPHPLSGLMPLQSQFMALWNW